MLLRGDGTGLNFPYAVRNKRLQPSNQVRLNIAQETIKKVLPRHSS